MGKKIEQQITIKKEWEARLKIIKAFNKLHNKNGDYIGFKILDKYDTRIKVKGYNKYDRGHYKCVTSRYIQKMILKEKYSLKLVNFILIDLFINESIRSFRCNDINEVIFHNYGEYGSRTTNDVLDNTYYTEPYSKLVEDYKYCRNIFDK